MPTAPDKTAQKTDRSHLLIPLLIILILMILMIVYTSRNINRVAVANIREVGEDRISGVAARLENYLDTARSVLWVTADTVDHMTRTGRTPEEIHAYIVEETEAQKTQFDQNITGFYGYVQGVFLDGLNWEPPEGYDPTQRDWYRLALEAGGSTAVIPPYVDAQTCGLIISFARMLSNGTDVVSLDVTMDHIQGVIADLQIKGKGYGFIVNREGMIIAHPDESRKGAYLTETDEHRRFMEHVRSLPSGNFEMDMNGRKHTVFVRQLLDQWYTVIAISSAELYAETWQQVAVNVLICLIIFLLIALFYYLGHKNEQRISRRMEEMKMEEQKQAYETRVLKLEKEAADQANKAKSDFLADMSHEIRTPINAVLGMNEMILRESEPPAGPVSPEKAAEAFTAIHRYAGHIGTAGSNLLSIINDILDFSKIEAGRMEIHDNEYELGSLLGDVCNLVYFRAREKGLEFLTDVDPSLPDRLLGDKVRIRQILTNLLSNAVKYTPRGSIRISVSAEETAFSPGAVLTLRFTVQDTGIGIRPEDQVKLFGKFQRVDLDRNSTVEGAGLGLAITASLLSLMGGSISVDSTYGRGSAFTVLLPQRIVSTDPVGSIRPGGEAALSGVRAGRETFRAPSAHLLIVDDTRMNLAVAVGLLRKTGVRIDTALSGSEALELLKTTAYDLILMDQRMPGMDGVETLHRLRAMQSSPSCGTPVLCLTADAIIGARERYMEEGFTDYLPKPVTGETLEKALLKYLPAEKVTTLPSGESDAPAPDPGPDDPKTSALYDRLRTAGIDPTLGLRYCQRDPALYLSILREYADGADARLMNLEESFSCQDWKQYGIQVHALKSTSRLIGAAALSTAAADLEAACSVGRKAFLSQEHPMLMAEARSLALTLQQALGPAEPKTAETCADEDGILEFFPEDNPS